MPTKLAIVSSHPIQYNAPLFKLMSAEAELQLCVFYTWGEDSVKGKYDPDFKRTIEWDIPLLDGYQYRFLKNTSTNPGSHHFKGIVNPHLVEEVETWGAEIVWVWGWSFHSHLKCIRYFFGKVPVWFRGDSTLLDEPSGFSSKKWARRLFLTWLYSHVDKAFYVGSNNKQYYLKHGLTEEKLVLASHAVENSRFGQSNIEDALDWRAELGINPDKQVLLFVGKLESKKNPLFFKNIIGNLSTLGFVGVMVGNGELENALMEPNQDNLFVLPFQNQSKMPLVYRLGDALVLPSKGPGETWGLAINEALASGIPVFASSKCGGAIDLITENTGRIIDIDNSEEASKQILEAMKTMRTTFDNSEFLEKFSYQRIIEVVLNNLEK